MFKGFRDSIEDKLGSVKSAVKNVIITTVAATLIYAGVSALDSKKAEAQTAPFTHSQTVNTADNNYSFTLDTCLNPTNNDVGVARLTGTNILGSYNSGKSAYQIELTPQAGITGFTSNPSGWYNTSNSSNTNDLDFELYGGAGPKIWWLNYDSTFDFGGNIGLTVYQRGNNTATSFNDFATNTTVVPEPVSSTLFLLGIAAMGARRLLRRKPV